MSSYRPLSSRGKANTKFDSLHEGIPPWMKTAAQRWIGPYLRDDGFIDSFEAAARLDFGRERSAGHLHQWFETDESLALDLLDYALHARREPRYARIHHPTPEQLAWMLEHAGSVWQVAERRDDSGERVGFWLVRRDLEEAQRAVERLTEEPSKPGAFLTASWNALVRRDPDPSGSYDKAVKAVEAAMHPIISPKNGVATLGTMRVDIRNKPSKWTFTSPVSADLVLAMTEALWTGHMRHGTDQRFGTAEDARTDHTVQEADAALHLAITLVDFFVSGHVTPAA
ncbi:hypothetical protein [Patulibacter defluvii]|uniref:hypothetical protein n=1 Tax=Patulibacter defluvii TaxID=3095358 RepID=UPI002A74F144|nr:hypothetical protein [Patulibacter sp. DM4]